MNTNAISLQEELDRATFGAMEPVIWEGDFWAVESSCGTTFLEHDFIGCAPALEHFEEYMEGAPEAFEAVTGWGAYLTMPGYMDRTELAVFNTKTEAIEYLLEQADEGGE